jgi:hypothetical protein
MTNLMMCFGDGTPSSALSHSPGCLTVSFKPQTALLRRGPTVGVDVDPA